jgi:hypothetical protein
MSKVNGGAFKYGAWIIIGGIFTLIAGIIDGYLRPLTCNK